MKKMIVCLLVILSCVSCSTKPKMEKELTIVVINDIHFLSPQLNDKTDYFYRAMLQADGRMTEYIDELVDAWVNVMLVLKPNIIVINGDYTYNGELKSNQDFEKKLHPLVESGIIVLINLGNHDLYSEAFAYLNNDVVPTETTTYEEYFPLYSQYGYDQAITKGKDELAGCYAYVANDKIMLMIIEGGYTMFYPEMLEWVQRQVDWAKENNLEIISFTHENIMLHNPKFDYGFRLVDSEKFIEIFKDEPQMINLSAHIHIQDIVKVGNAVDIANGGFIQSPHAYGIIHIDQNLKFTYDAVHLDTSSLDALVDAKDFTTYSSDYFRLVNSQKFIQRLDKLDIDEKTAQEMASYATMMNHLYFQGLVNDSYRDGQYKEVYDLWIKADTSFTNYLNNIFDQDGTSDVHYEIQLK